MHRSPRPLLAFLAPLASVGLIAMLMACQPATEDTRYITDEHGRALILHGLNVSGDAKWDPERMPWVGPEDVERMARDWGFNFSRFLITWDGVEPLPGVYDEAYLDRVAERLDWHHAAGIYVVLDMHQDLYGPTDSDGRSIGGNGHPPWSFESDGEPYTPNPGPWFLNYWQPAITRGFDNFWDYAGHPWLQDRYLAAWAHVVERFRDHPAVLGYDPINEPWPGSLVEQLEEFDAGPYRAFLERFIAAVRSVDEDGWLFFEPRAWGPNDGWPSYIGVLDDPRPGEDHLVYFPHYYSITAELFHGWFPDSDKSIERWVENRSLENDAQRAPLMIGEWGTGTDVRDFDVYLNAVARMADQQTSGWTYWDYTPGGWGPIDAAGNETPQADILARPYPRRVAGQPLLVDYDPETRTLLLTFETRPGARGPTEIYVPAGRHFPEGFALQVSSPGWRAAWDAEWEVLTLCVTPWIEPHRVVISPAAGAVATSLPSGVLEDCRGWSSLAPLGQGIGMPGAPPQTP